MNTFLSFIKKIGSIKKENLNNATKSFSKKQLFLFRLLFGIALFCTIVLLRQINKQFLVAVPAIGGQITEGIIGIPTQVNPVLALSDADDSLASIVYSGLMRKDKDGKFIPDLASSYEIDSTGTVYTFTMKNNITFHDGAKVAIDDVLFTVEKMQDPEIKSPKQITWEGVKVEKINENQITFTLAQPYISFIDNMTFGILPKHLWNSVDKSQFAVSLLNTKAIGSGPYKIDKVEKDKDGIPVQYNLSLFKNFALGKPNVKNITIVIYPNEKELLDGLESGKIDQAGGISAENVKLLENENFVTSESVLPRMFGLFFNSSKNVLLSNSEIISTLEKSIDKQEIIDAVLYGHGAVIASPVPNTILKDQEVVNHKISTEEMNAMLDKNGWLLNENGIREKGPASTTKTITKKVGKKTVTEKVTVKGTGPKSTLSFSLTTGDTPELQMASNKIKEQLAKVGIEINIKTYESGQLSQIIRSRDYEILFFGQILNHESDLYSFWHSSQKTDPGLNIALYSNIKVDALLANIQKTQNIEDRMAMYKNLVTEFEKDKKAILIYSPNYIYITKPYIKNIKTQNIINTNDRFSSIYTWYAKENYVWKIFNK